jgi:hypothetical protein
MAALEEGHCSSARMPWGESRTPSDPRTMVLSSQRVATQSRANHRMSKH